MAILGAAIFFKFNAAKLSNPNINFILNNHNNYIESTMDNKGNIPSGHRPKYNNKITFIFLPNNQ